MPDCNGFDVLSVGDLASRSGITIESRDDRLALEAPLLTGRFHNKELRRSLFLHASDVFEEADFVATSAQRPGLSCIFFLSGEVEVEFGGRSFVFRGDGGLKSAMIIPAARDESFRRKSRGRQRVRHLVISASHEWLDRDGLGKLDAHRPAMDFLADHLAGRAWKIPGQAASKVQRLLQLPSSGSLMQTLRMESAAVELVAEALSAVTHQGVAQDEKALTARDNVRLRRAQEVLGELGKGATSVEEIARQSGMSTSGLQRLFRAAYGRSVLEQIRHARLAHARALIETDAASIQQAAAEAGYSSPTNFATAFRRAFGITPSEAARRRRWMA